MPLDAPVMKTFSRTAFMRRAVRHIFFARIWAIR
jgi:hypothetical protein